MKSLLIALTTLGLVSGVQAEIYFNPALSLSGSAHYIPCDDCVTSAQFQQRAEERYHELYTANNIQPEETVRFVVVNTTRTSSNPGDPYAPVDNGNPSLDDFLNDDIYGFDSQFGDNDSPSINPQKDTFTPTFGSPTFPTLVAFQNNSYYSDIMKEVAVIANPLAPNGIISSVSGPQMINQYYFYAYEQYKELFADRWATVNLLLFSNQFSVKVDNRILLGDLPIAWQGTPNFATAVKTLVNDQLLYVNPMNFVDSPLSVDFYTTDGYWVHLVSTSELNGREWAVNFVMNTSGDYLDANGNELSFVPHYLSDMTCFAASYDDGRYLNCREITAGVPQGPMFHLEYTIMGGSGGPPKGCLRLKENCGGTVLPPVGDL